MISMRDHWRRFTMALRGTWREEYNPNDKLPRAGRGYWGMLGHSGKNLLVEALRTLRIYNRKGRTKDDLPYEFPWEDDMPKKSGGAKPSTHKKSQGAKPSTPKPSTHKKSQGAKPSTPKKKK